MFITIVLNKVFTRSSPVSSLDLYYSLPIDLSQDETHRVGVLSQLICHRMRLIAWVFCPN